jgi:hypothetical protein
MTFNDAIATASAAWFDSGITEAMTYNSASIRGHFEFLESGPEGVQAVVTVLKDDVSAPAYRDVVVYGGETYYAVRGPTGAVVRRGDAVSWEIYVSRDEGVRW